MDGLTVATIAKRAGVPKNRVASGLAVAKSDTGTRLVHEVALTLDQASDLLEFADDTDLVNELSETAATDPAHFPVAVQQARDERERRAIIEAATIAEEAKGHIVLAENDWSEPGQRLSALLTADGESVTAEDVQGKDGVSVRIRTTRDYDTKETTAQVTHFISNPAALGFTIRSGYATTPTGPMTDEQKAERKTLIANNKEWQAAETVRIEWLTTLVARKALPKNAARVIADGLTTHRFSISQAMNHGNSVAAALLGLTNSYGTNVLADYLDKHPTRAAHVSLAIVLGGIESSTSKNSWRNPDARTAAYLELLAGWGHTLSPVERIAAKTEAEATS